MEPLTIVTIGLDVLTLLLIIATLLVGRRAINKEEKLRLLPIVMLGSQDDSITNKNTIVIRNVGFGPALNAFTTPIAIDAAKIPAATACTCLEPSPKEASACVDFYHELQWVSKMKKATIRFNHRTAIAAGETQDLGGEEQIESESLPVQLTRDMCKEP